MLRGDMVTVFPPDVVTPPVVSSPPVTLVQFAFAMSRSSYTLAIKAPIKQRSIKETKMADRRVESRRTSVARAQAAARTETMNNTLRSALVCQTQITRSQWLSAQYVVRCELIGRNVTIYKIGLGTELVILCIKIPLSFSPACPRLVSR